jgi:hypothetical protein
MDRVRVAAAAGERRQSQRCRDDGEKELSALQGAQCNRLD